MYFKCLLGVAQTFSYLKFPEYAYNQLFVKSAPQSLIEDRIKFIHLQDEIEIKISGDSRKVGDRGRIFLTPNIFRYDFSRLEDYRI